MVILGNPAAGTPLIAAAPSVAIDLPLKILAWQDADGNTWVAYNEPAYLQARIAPDLPSWTLSAVCVSRASPLEGW
jgi:uncharacterized protein (DUF302 family)